MLVPYRSKSEIPVQFYKPSKKRGKTTKPSEVLSPKLVDMALINQIKETLYRGKSAMSHGKFKSTDFF